MRNRIRYHLPFVLSWTVIWAVFFATLLLGIERLPNGDFAGQFHAFGLFQFREIASGHFPLWSPGSFGGFPFAADTQSAAFYPMRWLMLLFSLPNGFTFQMLTLEGLIHIWLTGIFTYSLAFDITRQRTAALIASIAFALGGYITSYPLLQLAVLETITWLPLVLLLLRRGVLKLEVNGSKSIPPNPIPFICTTGFVLGLAALAGHPQTFLHISYLSTAYYLFLTAQAYWTWRWRFGAGACLGLIAIGTASIGLLPAGLYLSLATRSDVGYEFVSKGFPLLNYTHLLVPRTLSLWTPEYIGLLPITMASFAIWHRNRSAQSAEIVFWTLIALFAAWVSLGDKGILFEFVYHAAPGFSLFRQQERLISLVSLSLALLSANGLAIWMKLEVAEQRALVKKIIPFLGSSLILIGIILVMGQAIANNDWLITWIRQLGLAIIIVIALFYLKEPKVAHFLRGWLMPFVLVMLLVFDIGVPVRTAMNLKAESPTSFWPQPDWMETLLAEDPSRIDSRNLFVANVGEIYGLEDIRGISPLKLQLVEQFESLPRKLRWQLLNVTHVLTDGEIQEMGLTAVSPITESIMPYETVNGTLYRFEEALPRAWMSYEPMVVPHNEAAFQIIQSPEFDVTKQVVLTGSVDVNTTSPTETQPDVQLNRVASNRLIIDVKTAVSGILVISEWAVPGWKVTVNETAVSPLTANGGLMGVSLTAGSHHVELRYVPPGLMIGLVITAVTLLSTLVLIRQWRPVVTYQTERTPIPTLVLSWNWKRGLQQAVAWIDQNWWLCSLGLIFVGFWLRLHDLGVQELRGDEAFSYLFARRPASEIPGALLREGDPHSPFPYLLIHYLMQLVGDSELALRYASLVPGALLLPLSAQLARRIGGKVFALVVTLFMTISQSNVWISQDLRNQYTLDLMFIVSATLLLVWLLEKQSNLSKRSSVAGWVGYATLCALSVYSHYSPAFLLLGHGAFMLLHPPFRKQFWLWAGSVALAILLFMPWAVKMLPTLFSAGHLSDPGTPELAKFLTVAGIELSSGSAVAGGWRRWLFLVGMFLAIAGARQLWQHQKRWSGMMLVWLCTTLLFLYLLQFRRATFNPYYLTLAAPAWWILVVAGMQRLWGSRQKWRAITAVLALFAFTFVSLLSLWNYYTDEQYSRSQGYRQMVNHIAEQVQPNDLFLAHFPDPSLVYYLRNTDIDYTMQPSNFNVPANETEQALVELAAAYDRIWFVPELGASWDSQCTVPDWLFINTLCEQNATYNHLQLSAHRPNHAIRDITLPIQQQLGESILLKSVYVTVNGQMVDLKRPLPASPGATLDVTLLWQTTEMLDTHYTVFVQLLDENGMLVTQHDSVPAQGLRPTLTWPSGETILDPHSLILPADRTNLQGQLIVGMYETETVERLVYENGGDTAVIAIIQVDN